jgi:hypothetical protein
MVHNKKDQIREAYERVIDQIMAWNYIIDVKKYFNTVLANIRKHGFSGAVTPEQREYEEWYLKNSELENIIETQRRIEKMLEPLNEKQKIIIRCHLEAEAEGEKHNFSWRSLKEKATLTTPDLDEYVELYQKGLSLLEVIAEQLKQRHRDRPEVTQAQWFELVQIQDRRIKIVLEYQFVIKAKYAEETPDLNDVYVSSEAELKVLLGKLDMAQLNQQYKKELERIPLYRGARYEPYTADNRPARMEALEIKVEWWYYHILSNNNVFYATINAADAAYRAAVAPIKNQVRRDNDKQ